VARGGNRRRQQGPGIYGLGFAGPNRAPYSPVNPVMRYDRQLMIAVLHDRVSIAKNVNAIATSLDQAPHGYHEFDFGVARKFVLIHLAR
jgi:glutathione-independent formaldehyde dehydrogenase